MFSIGGREVSIKAVTQAIPSYTMSLFRLPLNFCDKLRLMIIQIWWGSTDEGKKFIGRSGNIYVVLHIKVEWDFEIW